jgi:hypothetical protein
MGEDTFEINGRSFRLRGSRVTPVFPGTIQLQGVGKVPARPAGELAVGNRIMWNYGHIYTVIAIRPSPSGKTLQLEERSEETGKVYTRRLGADRLVAILA